MIYGDEYLVSVASGEDLDNISRRQLSKWFRNGERLTHFNSSPDFSPTHDAAASRFDGLLCYRISKDRLIEINDAVVRSPVVIRNRVGDVISFQFVSTVKRREFLGKRKNVHDLGPALIVSVVPEAETTYRVPKTDTPIRHVVVHATLSTLFRQVGEDRSAYPRWLLDCLDGKHSKPRQRVFFLDEVHRDAIWSSFHLPVSGSLLRHWMSAKYDELLCVGLQILKNSRHSADLEAVDTDLPYAEKIRRARVILSMEYANPPPLPRLARQLGISETRLKSGFKAMTGTTVMQFCINNRIEAAKILLKEHRFSISEVASVVGYEDHSAFSRAFRRHCGQSPKEWRRSHPE